MNKKEFLNKLEKALTILNEKERKDIIDEYKDTIEEKVKHGQTEEEAVEDFGNIDELVSGILDAYKIDPDYNHKEGNLSKFTEEGEKLIKKGANKLADMTREFADNIKDNDAEMNLNLAFEIIIKIFFTLIILAIITIPLRFIGSIGFSLAETFLEPFSFIIKIIIFILFIALYLSIGFLIIINLFKQYFKKENKTSESKDKIDKQNEIHNLKKDETKAKEVKIIQRTGPTVGSVFLLILKIWVIIFILLPLFCIDIFSSLGLILSIFYWIKGINLLGLTLLMLGISLLFIWFTIIIFNLTFSKGKTTIIPFFIGLVITVFGALFFIDMVTNIEYINEAPSYKKETITKNFTSDNPYYINSTLNGNITKKIDNTMKDNELILKITYHKDDTIIDIYNESEYIFSDDTCTYNNTCEKNYNYISLNYDYSNNYEKNRYNEFIDNLKENKIYNYSKLNEVNIAIIANENTMKSIKIN